MFVILISIEGRLVRVLLLAIISDHPAMCKICGFADHGHNVAPCTKCKVTQAKLKSIQSLSNGTLSCQKFFMVITFHFAGFEARGGVEHRAKCFESKALPSDARREAFFETEGVRWSELARLAYFDINRQAVVDPMHNLLLGEFGFFPQIQTSKAYLGVAKTQWYVDWIKRGSFRASTTKRARELDIVHRFLDTVSCLMIS